MKDKECRIMLARLICHLLKKDILTQEDIDKLYGEPTVIRLKL